MFLFPSLSFSLTPQPPPPLPPYLPCPTPPPGIPPFNPPFPAIPFPFFPRPPTTPPLPPPPPKPPGPQWQTSPEPPPSPTPPPLGSFWYSGHLDLEGLIAELLVKYDILIDVTECSLFEQITYRSWFGSSAVAVLVWVYRRLCFRTRWVMYALTMAVPCATYLPLFGYLMVTCASETVEKTFGLALFVMQAACNVP